MQGEFSAWPDNGEQSACRLFLIYAPCLFENSRELVFHINICCDVGCLLQGSVHVGAVALYYSHFNKERSTFPSSSFHFGLVSASVSSLLWGGNRADSHWAPSSTWRVWRVKRCSEVFLSEYSEVTLSDHVWAVWLCDRFSLLSCWADKTENCCWGRKTYALKNDIVGQNPAEWRFVVVTQTLFNW